MGRYLDALTAQFDEITEGIEETLNRAADEGRDVTAEEAALVERDQARAEELKKSIEHYAGIEVTRGKVADMRSKLPAGSARTSTTITYQAERKPEEVLREAFPTAGDYLVTAGKALRGDKAAQEKILEVHRATQHQTLADNPGIVPRPIVGPVIDPLIAARPFISSITQQALVAPAFDRPHITQHVAVGKQAQEKQLTESQKLLLGKLPVTASTFAGHVNISRQDIKWSQPGVLQIIAQDFAKIYALETDEDAVVAFVASVLNAPIPVADWTAEAIYAAIYGAAAAAVTAKGPLPDTLWVSPDVWGDLGSLLNGFGVPIFPSMTPGSTTGNPLGLKLVVDPFFVPKTAILGPSSFAEWYEDVDGFLTVEEPDVLGQLVGYAGYGAFLNTAPELFKPLGLPATPLEATAEAPATKK